jgi:DNA invertase Pin-like site-specific DNA recombinase
VFVADVDPDKVATYIRWSTDDQTNGTTLEVQRDACEYYIKSQGWTFNSSMVYVDSQRP